jgi:hypothetical protein
MQSPCCGGESLSPLGGVGSPGGGGSHLQAAQALPFSLYMISTREIFLPPKSRGDLAAPGAAPSRAVEGIVLRRARYRPWSAWCRRRSRADGHGTELPIWNVRCHGEYRGRSGHIAGIAKTALMTPSRHVRVRIALGNMTIEPYSAGARMPPRWCRKSAVSEDPAWRLAWAGCGMN